jgi:hypothetical protein
MMQTTFQALVLCAMLLMSSLCGAHEVRALKVTILSTVLADDGIGEWGFAALIEADNYSLLLDTGNRPQTVLQNASALKLDLSRVHEVALTHFYAQVSSAGPASRCVCLASA